MIYDSNWYNLPVKYQKDIGHLISQKQNGVKLTVGPFADINRQLTTVVRSIPYMISLALANVLKTLFSDHKTHLLIRNVLV